MEINLESLQPYKKRRRCFVCDPWYVWSTTTPKYFIQFNHGQIQVVTYIHTYIIHLHMILKLLCSKNSKPYSCIR